MANAALIFFCIFLTGVAAAADTPVDKQKAKIVSRVYQLTYGADALCKRFSPQESAQVGSAVIRFKKAYPELMILVDESQYFEPAKSRFIAKMERIAESASNDPQKRVCQESLALLNQFIDTASGREGILDIVAQLKK